LPRDKGDENQGVESKEAQNPGRTPHQKVIQNKRLMSLKRVPWVFLRLLEPDPLHATHVGKRVVSFFAYRPLSLNPTGTKKVSSKAQKAKN